MMGANWCGSRQGGSRTEGTTGAALSSGNAVVPGAGRGPTRQKKRHLGSGPLGVAAL